MFRIVSTKVQNKLVTVLTKELDIKEFVISEEKSSISNLNIGDIIIGRVTNIVKNINSIFVEIAPGIEGYLSNKENLKIIYANGKTEGKPVVCDLILVQITKEPTKTKSFTLTTEITLMNPFVVLKSDLSQIHISSKFKDFDNYKLIRQKFQEIGKNFHKDTGLGFIVRKSAFHLSDEEFKKKLYDLHSKFQAILLRGKHGVKYEKISKEIPPHLRLLRDNFSSIEKIMTDDDIIYHEFLTYFQNNTELENGMIHFYQDDKMPLKNLYSISSTLEKSLSKKVWLKSGAYLVIEYTEALTVIDVNSGKAIAGKKARYETFMNINLEAAEEISRQIKLRNLSGMIIVDFIEIPEQFNKKLIENMTIYLRENGTDAKVVDITGLGLMEITRRRIGRPLHECIRMNFNQN